MTTTAGRPRKMSVYTRAGHRNQREREMPHSARIMPRMVPSTPDTTDRMSVLTRPVLISSGKDFSYRSQLKKVSPSCWSVDLGLVASVGGPAFSAFSAAIAAMSGGSSGSGAALLPGFQPRAVRAAPSRRRARRRCRRRLWRRAGVQGLDELRLVLADRPRDEVVDAEGVLDDRGAVALADGAFRLLRRRDPRVDLAALEVGVSGCVIGGT